MEADGSPDLPKVTFDRVLGVGRVSIVWLAKDESLGRVVVVKLLTSADPATSAAFESERHALGRLSHHPRILTIFDSGIVDGKPYLVLQYAEAGSVAGHLDRACRDASAAVRLLTGALEGLSFLHARGLVHGDVKPANLLVDEQGDVLLSDLGLASLMRYGFTIGYAAPELLKGAPASSASDVYALGATAVDLLTGDPAASRRSGEADLAYARRLVSDRHARLEAADVPDRLVGWINGLLADDPHDRPTAQQALRALRGDDRATHVGAPTARRPVVPSPGPAIWRRRMTISVALLAVVGIAVSLPNYRQPHGGEVAIADGSETDALPRTPSLREAEAPEAETGLGTTSPDPNSTTNLGDPSYVRIDLQGDAYTPALLDGYLYVVENGEDASRILRVDPETATVAATNELPIATAGPAVVGTAALIPFEQEGSPGLLWLDRSAREVDRFMPDEGAGDAVWRAQDPVFVGADLEDFEHDIFVRWGPSYRAVQFSNRIAGRRELAPGPVVAWDSPAGAVVWLLYPELGVLNRAEPLTESGERLVVRLEPELHGSGHEIIHPAPDGSLWLASRERIVTRIDGLTGEITGSVAAGACPVEDPLVGCRSLPSAGHGLVAHDSYWLTNRGDGALHRIDLASLELKASVQLSAGSTLGTPVATDDEILVSDHSRAVVHRIDVESNSLVSTIELECASGPCGEWAVGVEWQHRPLAVEGEVWLPWGEAIFRIR